MSLSMSKTNLITETDFDKFGQVKSYS